MNRLIAVDVETTGLDPQKCSIVSIGAVDIDVPERTFYMECNAWEGAEINSGALKVNGFSMEDVLSGKESEAKAIEKFFLWIMEDSRTPIMVSHNSAFDKAFIECAAARARITNPFGFRTIDIHSIVYMHLLRTGKEIPSKLSLNECLQSFGLDREPDPHNALTGAKCNESLFKKVRYYEGG